MSATGPSRSRFGSQRFFHVGGGTDMAAGWYMETREGVKGPFPSRFQAELFLADLRAENPRKRISNWHGDSPSEPESPVVRARG
ncbi:MAG: hypothetical protein WED00_13245 [Aquisalimonadaceae bacterium]